MARMRAFNCQNVRLATRQPASPVYNVRRVAVPIRGWAQLDTLVGEAALPL